MKVVGLTFLCITSLLSEESLAAQPLLNGTTIPEFTHAVSYYQQLNFTAARKAFYQLAQAGFGPAHFDLAVMAINGQGMERNPGVALGFLRTAKELGATVPDSLMLQAESAASEVDRDTASQIQNAMGIDGLAASFIDKYIKCTNVPDDQLARLPTPTGYSAPQFISSKRSMPTPTGAALMKRAGVLVISALIDAQGVARDPRIEAIVPQQASEDFIAAATEYLETARFVPGTFNGIPAPMRITIKYTFRPDNKKANIWDNETIQKFKLAANAKQPNGQYAVAYLSKLDSDEAEIIGLTPKSI
jgi:TPR repeat protein